MARMQVKMETAMKMMAALAHVKVQPGKLEVQMGFETWLIIVAAAGCCAARRGS
jgi:hypothetical protein